MRIILQDLTFPHAWQADILPTRPLILPPRHFTYPNNADEVERGALEVLVRPVSGQPLLATCALGFRDPAVPSGLWACPNPRELAAISGGYAYLIDTAAPEHFAMLPFRPVLAVHVALEEGLLLFVGHHSILAWGADSLTAGPVWLSGKLSDEGVTVTGIPGGKLHGRGWSLLTDKETPFTLDLKTGRPAAQS
jgi:hypothetical protein